MSIDIRVNSDGPNLDGMFVAEGFFRGRKKTRIFTRLSDLKNSLNWNPDTRKARIFLNVNGRWLNVSVESLERTSGQSELLKEIVYDRL